MAAFEHRWSDWLSELKTQHAHRSLRDPKMRILSDFSHNDYLGLSKHPRLMHGAQYAVQLNGTGATGSRLLSGNHAWHEQLEATIARCKGTEAAMVFNSGYQLNATALASLLNSKRLGAEPLLFADRLNHASLHHACQLAGVHQIRYRHLDMAHLAELLDKHKDHPAPKFIVTESVFGMDGDAVDIEQLCALVDEHDAFLFIDEAHATGVMGEHGYGLASGWIRRPDGSHRGVAMGTFSKALGSFGAYLACSALVRDFLLNHCTGFIYSTALPPSVVGANQAALDLLPTLQAKRDALNATASKFRAFCAAHGWDTGNSTTHIVPIIVGSAEKALAAKAALREAGVEVSAIRPPTVPAHTARLRIALSAAHDGYDLQRLQQALITALAP